MLSHSPKISLPSSGSSGKEATGPSLQLLSPALGPARECCRDAARMNKPGSSTRAAGRSLLLPAWPGTGSGSAELLGYHVLQGTIHLMGLALDGGSLGNLRPPQAEPAPGRGLSSTKPRVWALVRGTEESGSAGLPQAALDLCHG